MARTKDSKRKTTKKSKQGQKKKEQCEIFKIEKEGKEKTLKICVPETEKKEAVNENIAKKENKILFWVFVTAAALILIVIASYFGFKSLKHFNYNGMEFDIRNERGVIFYHTSFPLMYKGLMVNYNVYIRNDPRELESIPFNGSIVLREMMVLNSTDRFVCDGDGGIAIYNFQQILGALGTKIIKDPDAECDPLGRYVFLRIQPGNVTEIKQTGKACYDMYVSNCEILKATERFIMEVLTEKIGKR